MRKLSYKEIIAVYGGCRRSCTPPPDCTPAPTPTPTPPSNNG